MATATTIKPRSRSSVKRDCHTGKSALQPHQEAHVASNTFLPRCSDSVCNSPARSGSAKSGASRVCSDALRCAAPAPKNPDLTGGIVHDRIANPTPEGCRVDRIAQDELRLPSY